MSEGYTRCGSCMKTYAVGALRACCDKGRLEDLMAQAELTRKEQREHEKKVYQSKKSEVIHNEGKKIYTSLVQDARNHVYMSGDANHKPSISPVDTFGGSEFMLLKQYALRAAEAWYTRTVDELEWRCAQCETNNLHTTPICSSCMTPKEGKT